MKTKKLDYIVASGIIVVALTQFNWQCGIYKTYPEIKCETKNIDETIEEYVEKYGETPEAIKIKVLNKYFTNNSFEKLKSVPVVQGRVFYNYCAHAAGRNFAMNCAQIFAGYGWGKKTIITSEKQLSDSIVLHEYIHHASAFGLIDDAQFADSWNKMAQQEKYKKLANKIDEEINEYRPQIIMDSFNIWRTIERESKLAEKIIFEKAEIPKEMKQVYEKTLKF